jgi:phage terminase large subunit GpA-like protein
MSLVEAFRRGLTPDLITPLSQWCDENRVLPDTSARPGRWRTDVVPYMREVLDSLGPGNGIEKVVVMKAAQTAGTELCLNLLAYIVAHAPGPCLCVQPSLDMANRFVRGRVDKMIESMPVLQERIGGLGSKKTTNTLRRKAFPGGEIVFAGSNSAASLRSMPARYVLLDEVDSFEADLQQEGDAVQLAEARTVTYGPRKKVLLVSTPTIQEASRIEAAYLETDQRRYLCPCPHCGHRFELRWELLTWPEGERRKAHVVCPANGCVIEEGHKPWMLANGAWEATAESDGKSRGYAIGGLMSAFVSWSELAVEHGRVYRDPARHKAFVNTKLGLPWAEKLSSNIDAAKLAERAEDFGPELDEAIPLAVAGVDFQDRWFAMQIMGFGRGEEAWSLGWHRYHGDPSEPDFWGELDRLLSAPVRLPGGRSIPIAAACLDSGGLLTAKVLEFAATRHRRRVFAVKGAAKPGTPPWPRKPSFAKKGRWPLYLVGVDGLKEQIWARLPKGEPGPGALHWPADREATFFEELVAEKPRTKYVGGRPVREWIKPPHARNEALDTAVYAFAALTALKMSGLNLDAACDELKLAEPSKPVQKVSRSKWLTAA